MKKVLFIAYYWPPAGGPGSQRMLKFAKYLPEFGWQPVILTVSNGEFPYRDPSLVEELPSDLPVFRSRSREPFSFYKKITGKPTDATLPVGLLTGEKKSLPEKIAGWVRANLFVPDARIGWVPSAARLAEKILRQEDIAAIFSSSPPHSLQLIGDRLRRKFSLPWVADLRDPWTDIRYYQFVRRTRRAARKDAEMETRVLNNADHITTVSAALAESFREKILAKDTAERVTVLPNGYDELDFPDQSCPRLPDFCLLHPGNLLAHQNPEPLWPALARLAERFSDLEEHLRVRFVGRVHPSVIENARKNGLNQFIEQRDFVPHREILQEFRQAAVLFLVVPKVENNRGIITSKIFEYIGSGRPILAVGPPNGDAGAILKPLSNCRYVEYQDVEKCEQFLADRYEEWKSSGAVSLSPLELRQPYSRRNLSAQLSEILKRAAHKNG